jgi:hypothetical protein
MILKKLQEALDEIASQRVALNEVEAQLRSMIAKLSGVPPVSGFGSAPAQPASQPYVWPDGVTNGRVRDGIDDIVDVLRAEGRSLHISVIAERLSAMKGKKVLRTDIEPGLNRHVAKAKNPRIKKSAPSTYGLPEWTAQSTLGNIA